MSDRLPDAAGRPRLLLLRSGGADPVHEAPDLDVLVTHEIVPAPEAIRLFREAAGEDVVLVVSSPTTVRVLVEAEALPVPCLEALASGAQTGRALGAAGVAGVRIPAIPGAAGILADLPDRLDGRRVLWPRASDADLSPLAALAARGARLVAPVVYEKREARSLDAERVERFFTGAYERVALASLASLDVLLGRSQGRPLPQVRWGVLGPETARLLVERGLPKPVVPETPSLERLLDLLRMQR